MGCGLGVCSKQLGAATFFNLKLGLFLFLEEENRRKGRTLNAQPSKYTFFPFFLEMREMHITILGEEAIEFGPFYWKTSVYTTNNGFGNKDAHARVI